MRRYPGFLTAVAIAVVAHAGTLRGAGGTISGSAKITGVPSSADTVVYIQEAAAGAVPSARPVEMNQVSYKFIPHVLPVVTGTTVRFLNGDAAAHNVFSPDYEKYDMGTWNKGESKEYAFVTCAKPPCVYTQLCKAHPQMDAYIVVLQNQYFGVTDKDGHYEIRNVPPGKYTVAVWHARRYSAQPTPVTVDASAPAKVDFVLRR